MDSVEVFDLSGTGSNSLVLDALAVFDVTEEREGGAASLDVLGDADDRVELSSHSFALTGTDANLFTINANTGEVSFIAAPDFEMPSDADGDNVYDINVTASDGTNRTDKNVAITVTDEENDPVNLSRLDGTNGFTLTGDRRG